MRCSSRCLHPHGSYQPRAARPRQAPARACRRDAHEDVSLGRFEPEPEPEPEHQKRAPSRARPPETSSPAWGGWARADHYAQRGECRRATHQLKRKGALVRRPDLAGGCRCPRSSTTRPTPSATSATRAPRSPTRRPRRALRWRPLHAITALPPQLRGSLGNVGNDGGLIVAKESIGARRGPWLESNGRPEGCLGRARLHFDGHGRADEVGARDCYGQEGSVSTVTASISKPAAGLSEVSHVPPLDELAMNSRLAGMFTSVRGIHIFASPHV